MPCNRCGLCCKRGWFVRVTDEDRKNIPESLLQRTNHQFFTWVMAKTDTLACIAYQDGVGCTIYESRPAVCRDVEAESSFCLSSQQQDILAEEFSWRLDRWKSHKA